jgi:hypothetical protein
MPKKLSNVYHGHIALPYTTGTPKSFQLWVPLFEIRRSEEDVHPLLTTVADMIAD